MHSLRYLSENTLTQCLHFLQFPQARSLLHLALLVPKALRVKDLEVEVGVGVGVDHLSLGNSLEESFHALEMTQDNILRRVRVS